MDQQRAFAWSGKYFLLTSVLAIVGAGIVGAGLYFIFQYGGTLDPFGIPYPSSGRSWIGVVAIVIGVAIWRGGKAWALYFTLTGAMAEELGDTYDTEHVKSDIVAVLDERLSDMQQDLQSVNRELRTMKDSSGFEFNDDS